MYTFRSQGEPCLLGVKETINKYIREAIQQPQFQAIGRTNPYQMGEVQNQQMANILPFPVKMNNSDTLSISPYEVNKKDSNESKNDVPNKLGILKIISY